MSAKSAQTVADLSLDELFQAIRTTVVETVTTLMEPVNGSEPDTDSEPVKPQRRKVVNLSDGEKAAKTNSPVSKYIGREPQGPASFKTRKRIAAFGDLGDTATRTMVFEGGLNQAQAVLAAYHLEEGRSVKIGDAIIRPIS